MLLHSVIEEQHHISKRRVQLTGNHPGTRLVWALEVEKNHTERLITLIRSVCKATDLIVSIPESLSGFTSTSTRRDESYDSNSLSKAASKTQSVHNPAKGGSNLIFSSTNLVNETILPMEAFRAVRRMFFVPHSCHDPICIVSHPDFTSLFSHDTVPPSDGKAVGRRSDEEMERSLMSNLRRIINFKVQTSPKELSKYLEDMIKTSQNGQHCDLVSFAKNCSAAVGTSNSITDHAEITKENNQSSTQNDEGHTHLLQCIYSAHDGIFRWGITEKKESLDLKLTAESIEYGICHERKNRFERDGLSHNGGHFHPGVHVHSGGLNGVERSGIEEDTTSREIGECEVDLIGTLHEQESCSLINPDSDSSKNENKYENKKESSPSIQQNSSRKYQGLALDPEKSLLLQEENIQSKSAESVEILQKKVRTSESFKPASRAYYKMSEIKEFYFPLWNWTWPGDVEGEEEEEEREERGVVEDHAGVRDDQGEEEDEREGGGEGEAEFKKTNEATREQELEKCKGGIEYEGKSRKGSRNKCRSTIQCCAIDVGSSPGGWTQCLSAHCARVLSVDPGALRQDVVNLKNVEYVCGTIESVLALNAMQRISINYREHLNKCHGKRDSVFINTESGESMTHVNAKSIPRNSGLRVAVCDVNIGAVTAATLLSSYVLPHMKDACKCRCSVSQGKSYTHNQESSISSISSISSSTRCDNSVINNFKNTLERNVDNDYIDNNCNGKNIFEEVTNQILNMSIDKKTSIRNSRNNIVKCSEKLTNNEKKSFIYKNNRKCYCGGYVVLTLKLVKNAKDSYIKNAVDSASVILAAAGCYDFHAVHLGANSRNERTLVCRFKV